jgi:hypothetical protein
LLFPNLANATFIAIAKSGKTGAVGVGASVVGDFGVVTYIVTIARE